MHRRCHQKCSAASANGRSRCAGWSCSSARPPHSVDGPRVCRKVEGARRETVQTAQQKAKEAQLEGEAVREDLQRSLDQGKGEAGAELEQSRSRAGSRAGARATRDGRTRRTRRARTQEHAVSLAGCGGKALFATTERVTGGGAEGRHARLRRRHARRRRWPTRPTLPKATGKSATRRSRPGSSTKPGAGTQAIELDPVSHLLTEPQRRLVLRARTRWRWRTQSAASRCSRVGQRDTRAWLLHSTACSGNMQAIESYDVVEGNASRRGAAGK